MQRSVNRRDLSTAPHTFWSPLTSPLKVLLPTTTSYAAIFASVHLLHFMAQRSHKASKKTAIRCQNSSRIATMFSSNPTSLIFYVNPPTPPPPFFFPFCDFRYQKPSTLPPKSTKSTTIKMHMPIPPHAPTFNPYFTILPILLAPCRPSSKKRAFFSSNHRKHLLPFLRILGRPIIASTGYRIRAARST